jgi:hypothetical protein
MKIDPPDQASLAEAPLQLSWTEVASAESYKVVVYDFELTPIWESPQVSATSIQIPDSIRASLKRGQRTYWRVIANSGAQRRQSDLFQFVILP